MNKLKEIKELKANIFIIEIELEDSIEHIVKEEMRKEKLPNRIDVTVRILEEIIKIQLYSPKPRVGYDDSMRLLNMLEIDYNCNIISSNTNSEEWRNYKTISGDMIMRIYDRIKNI